MQLLLEGSQGVAALLIESGQPGDLPAESLSLAYLRFEAEFARVRSVVAGVKLEIELARVNECNAFHALRTKQCRWRNEHPDEPIGKENAEYMAFIERELSAVVAASSQATELKRQFNDFLLREYEKLREFREACQQEERSEPAEPDMRV